MFRRRFPFLASLLFLSVGGYFVMQFSKGAEEGLGLSEADYASGKKRFAAVKKKVTPSLKTAFTEKKLKWGSPVFLRAFKEEKTLEVWVQNREGQFTLFQSYPIAAASGDLGPKLREGDQQVPEGFYFVNRSRMKPDSAFHLAFNIGYPNKFDQTMGRTGSFIMVHGSNLSIGCLAMTDEKIEEIYTLCDAALSGGQSFFRIHIFPFRMTDDQMALQSNSEWLPFWQNLRKGYQWFEEKKSPPNVTVSGGKYLFK